jgi:hypothetical protein
VSRRGLAIKASGARSNGEKVVASTSGRDVQLRQNPVRSPELAEPALPAALRCSVREEGKVISPSQDSETVTSNELERDTCSHQALDQDTQMQHSDCLTRDTTPATGREKFPQCVERS